MKEGGRGNSNRLVNIITRVLVVGQIAFTARAPDCGDTANQINSKSGYAQLWLRRQCHLCRAHGPDGRRLPDAGCPPGIFPSGGAGIAS